MNQLNESQMELHAAIVGWLRIGSSAIILLVGVGLFTLLTGIGVAVDDRVAFRVLTTVGTVLGWVFVLLALPGILAGIGVLAHKSWGRVLAIIIGAIDLANFPVGTFIGAYSIFVLIQDAAGEYFTPTASIQKLESRAN